MNVKTLGIVLLILIAGQYLAPYISTIFSLHSNECDEYYRMVEKDTYSIEYAERLKAVSEKCL